MGFSIHILQSGNFTFHCVVKVRKKPGNELEVTGKVWE